MKKKAKSRGPRAKGLSYWEQLVANYKPPGRKARPKQKAATKPKQKGNNMSTKKENAKATADEEAAEQAYLAEQGKKKPKAQQTEAPAQQAEETLPPHAPPVVPSLPTEPAAPDAVDDSEKGAHPEDEGALRELDLVVEGTRGVGPSPEEPEPPPEPPPGP
jgi:hypothetical protein